MWTAYPHLPQSRAHTRSISAPTSRFQQVRPWLLTPLGQGSFLCFLPEMVNLSCVHPGLRAYLGSALCFLVRHSHITKPAWASEASLGSGSLLWWGGLTAVLGL
jgi:hypothetical protein